MPREHRKRGKKHKKTREDEAHFQDDLNPNYSEREGEPSWIRPASETSPETSIEAPFGYVDADVKAYFRTVDDQIRDWQEADGSRTTLTEESGDPNEGTLC
jgi:nucleolar protein 9